MDSLSEDVEKNDIFTVWVKVNDQDTLLANLSRRMSQVQVDAAFGTGQTITFDLKGKTGTAYLSGYFILNEEEFCSVDANQGSTKANPVQKGS